MRYIISALCVVWLAHFVTATPFLQSTALQINFSEPANAALLASAESFPQFTQFVDAQFDSAGNMWIVGNQGLVTDEFRMTISKLDPNGNVLFNETIWRAYAVSICIDPSDDDLIWMSGTHWAPDTVDCHDDMPDCGSSDSWIAQYVSHVRVWEKRFGTGDNQALEGFHNIGCTSDGGVIVGGGSVNSWPNRVISPEDHPSDTANAMYFKLDSTGEFVWSRLFGGTGSWVWTAASGLIVDANNDHMFAFGWTTGDFDGVDPDLPPGGGADNYIVKLNASDGSVIAKSQIYTDVYDGGMRLIHDPANNRLILQSSDGYVPTDCIIHVLSDSDLSEMWAFNLPGVQCLNGLITPDGSLVVAGPIPDTSTDDKDFSAAVVDVENNSTASVINFGNSDLQTLRQLLTDCHGNLIVFGINGVVGTDAEGCIIKLNYPAGPNANPECLSVTETPSATPEHVTCCQPVADDFLADSCMNLNQDNCATEDVLGDGSGGHCQWTCSSNLASSEVSQQTSQVTETQPVSPESTSDHVACCHPVADDFLADSCRNLNQDNCATEDVLGDGNGGHCQWTCTQASTAPETTESSEQSSEISETTTPTTLQETEPVNVPETTESFEQTSEISETTTPTTLQETEPVNVPETSESFEQTSEISETTTPTTLEEVQPVKLALPNDVRLAVRVRIELPDDESLRQIVGDAFALSVQERLSASYPDIVIVFNGWRLAVVSGVRRLLSAQDYEADLLVRHPDANAQSARQAADAVSQSLQDATNNRQLTDSFVSKLDNDSRVDASVIQSSVSVPRQSPEPRTVSEDSGSNSVPVVAVVLGSLGAVAVVAGIAFFIRRNNLRAKQNQPNQAVEVHVT